MSEPDYETYDDGSPVSNFMISLRDGTRWHRTIDDHTWTLDNFWELSGTVRETYAALPHSEFTRSWEQVEIAHAPLVPCGVLARPFLGDLRTGRPWAQNWLDELRAAFEARHHELPERTAHVLRLRYGLNGRYPRPLDEIGMLFGVTRERIRQLDNEGLKALGVWTTRRYSPRVRSEEGQQHQPMTHPHTEINTGALIDGARPIDEDHLRRALREHPTKVLFDATAALGAHRGRIIEAWQLPQDVAAVVVCGPDPYRQRDWWLKIRRGDDGNPEIVEPGTEPVDPAYADYLD